jgi:hypothetical protein
VLFLVGAVTVTGCGHSGPGEPAATAYDGPLHVSAADGSHPRAGAAGEAVDCTTWGTGGSSRQRVYSEGATADSPQQALEVARSERGFDGVQDGLEVAAQDEDRVLYVVEVDGRIKQAVIVHDGPATDGAGGPGWYVESWARCDLAELPDYAASMGVQTWTDASGASVPTRTVQSYAGPEHCDWQSMTFLEVRGGVYVRAPLPELARYFDASYRSRATLPADAVDTGYRRDGNRLWLGADGRWAFIGTPRSVEAWPRTSEPLSCG